MITISLNRFHRLSMWCGDCNTYWQSPNYMVVLYGTCDEDILRRLLRINMYMYRSLFQMSADDECFGADYNFEQELNMVFLQVQQSLRKQSRNIKVLDIDIVSYIEENLDSITRFVVQMQGSFETMALRLIENSPRSFLTKLESLRRNIVKSLLGNNLKCAIDNLMELNTSGLDILVQCVGMIFNCFYILSVNICEPEIQTPGIMYCNDAAVILERLANISVQSYLYKYKRRWLVYYRELLQECKSLFGNDLKLFNELQACGNFETIEACLYDMLIVRNEELVKLLAILRHNDRYPKCANKIYDWWSGRSKEQLQKIYNAVDDCVGMDKKSNMLPFILTHKLHAKDRLYYDILNVLRLFDHINPDLSQAIGFIMRIYPEVFEQVYFPDRDRYIALIQNRDAVFGDTLDNIRNKTSLQKCENVKCQQRNKGENVIWNLNSFELGKYSMNTIIKELLKNPKIFEEILKFAQKNFDIAINANSITRKIKKVQIKS